MTASSKPRTRLVRVLFLSNGNTARSPIAEAVLHWLSRGAAAAWSAGVSPGKEIHPMARVAVRNVFNGRINNQRPKSVEECGTAEFDYVVTLSEDAYEGCPTFDNNPFRIHWPLQDPTAAEGARDRRQQAFDRVTRDVLKRVRRWWLSVDATRPPGAPPRAKLRQRPSGRARWRTLPDVDAPVLAVAYFGRPRSCTNMCALIERSGYQVLCGEYGRAPGSLPVVPHGILIRVDGRGSSPARPRPEFLAMQNLRREMPHIPILLLVDRVPSQREREIVQDCTVNIVQRRPQSGRLIPAIERLIGRSTDAAAVPAR